MAKGNSNSSGAQVTALTYPDDERDRPPRRVTGKLVERWVPTLAYTQLVVAGVPVDPGTVKLVRNVLNAGDNCGTGAGGFQPGNTCAKGSEGSEYARSEEYARSKLAEIKEELAKSWAERQITRRDVADLNDHLRSRGSEYRLTVGSPHDESTWKIAKSEDTEHPHAVDKSEIMPWEEAKEAKLFSDYKSWGDHLSASERDALAGYNTISYQAINAYHRTGRLMEIPKGELDENSGYMDRAIAKATVKEDTHVYRGMDVGFLGRGFEARLKSGNLKGLEFTDKAYVSTTVAEEYAKGFKPMEGAKSKVRAYFNIKIPKGAHAAYMPAVDTRKSETEEITEAECEMLLPRNSRFRITGVTTYNPYRPDKRYEVHAELING